MSTTIRVEAEDLTLDNFIVDSTFYDFASEEQLIRLSDNAQRTGTTAKATTLFNGASGTYEVIVGHHDENDGTATLQLTIGASTQSLLLDEATNSGRPMAANFRTWTAFESVALTKGQAITLSGTSNTGEAIRVDYIDFVSLATNSAPVATKDSYKTAINTPLVISAGIGLLANDTDSDDDSLTAAIATEPTNGTVTIKSDGSFVYTPATDSLETDTFTYIVSDGTDTDEGTVTITIQETLSNSAPVATKDSYRTAINTPLVIPAGTGLLANDTDSDDDSLTAIIATEPTNGTVTIKSDGSFVYTPATDSLETDTFTYIVSDGIDTDEGTVTITIQETPFKGENPFARMFTFDQFVRFEEIDEQRSYQGNIAELSTEIGGINIASIFDEIYYLDQNTDVAAAVSNGAFAYGFQHFLQFGYLEGRNPSALFDEAFYLSTNGDIQGAVNNNQFSSGLEHFLLFGHLENRNPSELFDASDYLTNNPDVAAAINNKQLGSAFEHYVELGADEGRLPNLLAFNEAYYLAINKDVAQAVKSGAFASGFDHYVSFGQREGRDPGSLFDESAYLVTNPDVAAAVPGSLSSGFEHYFRYGRAEERGFAVSVG